MMHASSLLLLILLLAAGPSGAQADAEGPPGRSCAEEIALRVEGHYESVRDLTADFVQTSRVVSLGQDAGRGTRAGGQVIFAKPGRMRWAYREPEESLVVTDGKVLWTWDPGLGEAQRVAVAAGFLSGAAIQFLLGEGAVLESFEVTADRCEGSRVTLRMLPLDPSSYERLQVEVDPKAGIVHATEVVDLFGNVTRIEFAKIRTNTSPDDSLFGFEPPEGARVIEVPGAP
jgi:outer membrane lipoprotein carrier protein